MIVSDVNHVICINGSKGCKTVTHDGEEGNKNTVNHMYNVILPVTKRDPSYQEKDPDQTKQGD